MFSRYVRVHMWRENIGAATLNMLLLRSQRTTKKILK